MYQVHWKGTLTSLGTVMPATCMLVEGEDSLPTKCPMNHGL